MLPVVCYTPHPACVQARFTFLYKQVNGQWKIAEHHSSAMPEVQPAGVAEMFDRWNLALQVGIQALLKYCYCDCYIHGSKLA